MKTLSADALWDFHNRAFLNYCPKFNSKELQLPSTGTCACFSWTGNWLIVYSLFALLLLFKNSLFALEYNTTTSYHHHICYKKKKITHLTHGCSPCPELLNFPLKQRDSLGQLQSSLRFLSVPFFNFLKYKLVLAKVSSMWWGTHLLFQII